MSSKKYQNSSVVQEIKEHLKSIGLSQTGDKGTLIHRISMYDRCVTQNLTVDDNNAIRNPCLLKLSELKISCSKRGLSPIGIQDELLQSLITWLEQNNVSSKKQTSDDKSLPDSVNNSQSASTTGRISSVDEIAVAKRVLELIDVEDYEGILNLGINKDSERITRQTAVGSMRKAYLKLSLLIHPDKLGSRFGEATKAFQALVKAFENLSSPSFIDETETPQSKQSKNSSTKKVATISRSNEGCFRTRVRCPRCKTPWSDSTLDGNPDYYYNFLMMGIKQFLCSTCLCEFGCMTALHECPFCRKNFEYSPADFHRKICCGNSKCNKPFGFYLFNVSDRIMNGIREELKAEQERRQKAIQTKKRRAMKSASSLNRMEEESAFIMGLIDCCPRCGELLEGYPTEEEQRQHLMECNDVSKHKEFKAVKEKDIQVKARKEELQSKQDSVQTHATWQFLGGKQSQLWLLDDEHLRVEALNAHVDGSGSKTDLISRIIGRDEEEEEEAVTVYSAHGSKRQSRKRVSIESLPSNMYSMSLEQLLSVCASFGLSKFLPKNPTKDQVIEVIEFEIFEEKQAVELQEDSRNVKRITHSGDKNSSKSTDQDIVYLID